jgi:predicted TPR repeat methyltransferase
MSSSEEILRQAISAHQAGRLAEAEVGYRKLLRKHPTEPTVLHYLGLVHFRRGEHDAAIDHLRRSLERRPENPRGWNDLGGILIAAGQTQAAQSAYRRATEVAPQLAEGWYNLAVCQRRNGETESAVDSLQRAVASQPDYGRAYDLLATLLYQLGRPTEAAATYAQWHRHSPGDPEARHMAAASSGENVPGRASDEYVKSLFDRAARTFDSNLESLDYRAPQVVATALAHWAAVQLPLGSLLDAGCGTGLCGPLVRRCCKRLVGIDLSEKMLEHARERACYDELVAAELTAYLRSHRSQFDGVICADTLVYFGPLEDPLSAARDALRDSGILVFTVEASSDEHGPEHRLQSHGRYAHSESYLCRVVPAAGFRLSSLSRETLRQERGADVPGYLVVAHRI